MHVPRSAGGWFAGGDRGKRGELAESGAGVEGVEAGVRSSGAEAAGSRLRRAMAVVQRSESASAGGVIRARHLVAAGPAAGRARIRPSAGLHPPRRPRTARRTECRLG
jgi:hypothetical protein